MSTPLEFAARFLARRGALVEASPPGVEALLPASLAADLGLGEHVVLGEGRGTGTHQIGYGSAVLERMVTSATGALPFVAARAAVAPARASQASAAAEGLAFRNGVFSVGAPLVTQSHRLVLHALFALHGDERREGLCSAAVSLLDHGIVPGFHPAVAGALEDVPIDEPEPAVLVEGARAAHAACAAAASEAAAGFQEGMQRRFARDQERLEGYFHDLLGELDSRVSRGRVTPAEAQERRQVLERERAAKLEELSARYAMRLELTAVAALLVESPVVRVPLELRRRKATRSIEVEYDSATRRLVMPPCEACRGAAPRPAACDDAMHLLCDQCAPRAEGRIACGACRGRRGRRTGARAA